MTDPATRADSYDFRQPARLSSDAGKRVAHWQRRIASLLPDKLSAHVKELECEVRETEFGRPDEVSPPHPLLAYRLQVNGQHETILAIYRPLAVTLVAAMLGEPQQQLAADRPLTLVEQSLIELAVRDIVDLLDESGAAEQIRTNLLGAERRTQLIRLFNPQEAVTLLNFELQAPFGSGVVCWAWPQALLEAAAGRAEPPAPSPELPELVQRLPFEVVVRLGGAQLHVHELAGLKPGDILVLDQPVSEPLATQVGGVDKLRVWPGREGSRQSVQVASWS